eukprot:1194193-Prorocentrum_minimum.AAC.9
MLSGPPTPNVTTATAVCPLLKYLSARFFVRSLIRPTCSGQRCRTIQWQKSQTLETPQVGVEIQGSDPMFREGRWLVGFGVMYLRHYDEKIPTRMHTAGAYTWTQSLEEVVVAVGCPKGRFKVSISGEAADAVGFGGKRRLSGTKSNQIKCKIRPSNLSLSIAGIPEPTVFADVSNVRPLSAPFLC